MEEFTLDLIPDIDIEPLYLPEVPKEKNTPPVMSSILQVEMMVQDLRERVKHLEIMHERRQLFPLPLIWLKRIYEFGEVLYLLFQPVEALFYLLLSF